MADKYLLVWQMCGEALDFPVATAAILVSIMLRATGKRRALSVLEKREIYRERLEPEHAKEKLTDFSKNFLDQHVGNHIEL